MTVFNPGSDGSLTAVTLENQFFTLVNQVHLIQNDAIKNPTNAADLVDSTIDVDSRIVRGSLNLYMRLSLTDGILSVDFPDPFVSSGWVEGTSGDGFSANYNDALHQRVKMLIDAERENSTVSDLRITNPAYTQLNSKEITPVEHNGLFTCDFRLELEAVSSGDGTIFMAKEYT